MTQPPNVGPTPKPAKSDPDVRGKPYPGSGTDTETFPDDVGGGRGEPSHEKPDPKGGTGPSKKRKKG